jgi:hypothetical protein
LLQQCCGEWVAAVAVVASSFDVVVLSLFFKKGSVQGFLKSQQKGSVATSNNRTHQQTLKKPQKQLHKSFLEKNPTHIDPNIKQPIKQKQLNTHYSAFRVFVLFYSAITYIILYL